MEVKRHLYEIETDIRVLLDESMSAFKPESKSEQYYLDLISKSSDVAAPTEEYIRLLYDTLVYWKMNSRGAKLSPYERFKQSIIRNWQMILDLRGHSLCGSSDKEFEELLKKLRELFDSLELTASGKPKLVTFSKTLHFMLPDLVVPMDNTYTLPFLFRSSQVDLRSFDPFEAALREFRSFSMAHPELTAYLDRASNPNIPKILDNIIIGWIRQRDRKPAVVDLFCGAGGLSEGFRMAGYKVLLGLDMDKHSIETFRKNHKGAKVITEDVRKISAEHIRKMIGNARVDVIVGGPPCQGFSVAGERDPRDPRNSLFMEFIRIVGGLRPEWVVMENVPGILTMRTEAGELVKDILTREFERIGYRVDYRILMAADYGVPQKRRRVFFMATRTNKPIIFPSPTHSSHPSRVLSGEDQKKWVGVGEILFRENEVEPRYFHSERMISGFLKRKEMNRSLGNGFGWQILRMDEPSYTISARYWKDGGDAIVRYDDHRIRMLTEREAARVQSFPDSYLFTGPRKEIYRQIGNAVPPLLAKALALQLKKAL